MIELHPKRNRSHVVFFEMGRYGNAIVEAAIGVLIEERHFGEWFRSAEAGTAMAPLDQPLTENRDALGGAANLRRDEHRRRGPPVRSKCRSPNDDVGASLVEPIVRTRGESRR